MRRSRAWERLHDTNYSGGLSTEGFYELLLEAGYPEKVAQAAANQRGWGRLEAGMKL